MGSSTGWFLVITLVGLTACAPPAFSRALLVVDLTRAPIPVMLSQVKREPRPGTKPLAANDLPPPLGADGLPETAPKRTPNTIYTFDDNRVTEQSSSGASEQLLGEIGPHTVWVSVRAAVFNASDASQLASSQMRRELSLQTTGRQ